MEENESRMEEVVEMGETQEFVSPFEGTPWGSDQEIYDFASAKFSQGWKWPNIREELVKNGLNEDYADAIIENMEEAYGQEIEEPASYVTGVIVGVFMGGVIGAMAAGICIVLGRVLFWIVVVATLMVGAAVQGVSHRRTWVTGIIAAVCGAIGVISFVYTIENLGYVWDDGTMISDNLWLYMGLAALVSGFAGMKDNSKKEK